ncbi:hypothetical protein AMEX_G8360 [Astyanax mexicanus]|uniref:Uncharacterized protein n=1 Tax=Astyanax mexicanus TaxID=7994 RepID=A0A8T2LVY3_ASTMX|nr:hypothetical protein AMEX_G8360 [Astyanax mexicanus]
MLTSCLKFRISLDYLRTHLCNFMMTPKPRLMRTFCWIYLRQNLTWSLGSETAIKVVLAALQQRAGGDAVLTEYGSNNTLSSETRRVLVNIVVGHMMEMHG